MSDDDDDRTVFGQALPTPPALRPRARLTSDTQNDDERTILARRPVDPGASQAGQVPLAEMLQLKTRRTGLASNTIMAAAADLMELLGLLRTGLVEMQSEPLHAHLRRRLVRFDQDARAMNVRVQDIADARYALAATCDDIAQNLPGTEPGFWRQNSLTVKFFDDPNPGVGFFTRLHRLSANPGRHGPVLELMLACLALGFEGQYRKAPDGMVALVNLRKDVYQRVRSTLPRPRPALSSTVAPVVLSGRRRHARMPLWIIAGVGAGMVVSLYVALAWTLTQEAQAAQATILGLHDPNDPIAIERIAVPEIAPTPTAEPEVVTDATPEPDNGIVLYEAPPTGQVDRVRARLQVEIDAGLTTVTEEGDFVAIRLGPALQFGAGAANLTSENPIIVRIAEVLEEERGGIIVEGHSDNIPLSGRGRYKTNEELSEARAATVRDVLARYLSDPERLSVVGAGAAKPLDRTNTPAARARNRRVDILLLKEQRL
ncbi:type IVB secretion system protein IcmH/DotU [uncultured Tateyamaria sp.]|uniref:type IVB secretion system protein IcmH/DotU n=1 Tax=uncultured Tateyamaria sp. TaxID=455651 RepID=UPI002612618A|nr:type IVB secretion system protein IcmH/DotU [uncultured Tateyamaria sp.]